MQPASASTPAADWTSIRRRVTDENVIQFLRESGLSNITASKHLGDRTIQLFASANIFKASQQIFRPHARALALLQIVQDPAFVHHHDTIAENLVLASHRGKARGLGIAVNRRIKAELRDRIRPLNMGLEDRLDNPIGSLSGGQRQALTLLMASWLKPELLLLDEHTAALDPKTADQVIRLTHDIIERDRLTTLMVTHSMQQAVNLGDRIVMMHKGRVLHDLQESERARVRPEDLLRRFEDVRRREQLDGAVAEMLAGSYV